ncbi:MAG: O-antigen ligase family protein [bacterium]|nr:O-antigen ligase family protein [bacterium]MDA1024366.1 O-antigen ligase family protein [bacterium]
MKGDFWRQFITTQTWWILGAICGLHVFSFLVPGMFDVPLLILVGIGFVALAWKRLDFALGLALVEVIIGSHGRLIEADIFTFSLSLRMAIFGGILLGWLIGIVLKRHKYFYIPIARGWLLLLVAVLIGSIVGIFDAHDVGILFDDANSYAVALYIFPILSVNWGTKEQGILLQFAAAGVIWLTGFTILLELLFTHLPGKILAELYTFVRDQRLAEVTLQVINADQFWYRIFFQSHLFVASGLLIAAGYLYAAKEKLQPGFFIALGAVASVLAISSSRSSILALLPSLLGVVIAVWILYRTRAAIFVQRSVLAILAGALGIILTGVLIMMPPRTNLQDAAFYETSAEAGRELAISSRWNLLGPMLGELQVRPVLGSGFGEEVTYTTDDPRIRAMGNEGVYTTYRFEWGYLDIWLKMGLLGFFAMALILIDTFSVLLRSGDERDWIRVALAGSVGLVAIAHIFTPYLNHPIGLMLLLFMIPFIPNAAYTAIRTKQADKRPAALRSVPVTASS